MELLTKKRNILVLVLFTNLVLYFTLKDSFSEIVDHILNINIWWLFLALIFMFLYWALRSLSYYLIIRKIDSKYKYKRVLNLTLLTQFFNGITPFSTGGQPLVIYTLKKDGINMTKGTNIVMQDFIIYQTSLVIMGTMAIAYNYYYHIFKEVSLLKEIVTIGYLVNIAVVIILFMVAFSRKSNKIVANFIIRLLNKFKLVKYKEKTLAKWNDNVNNFHDGAKLLFSDYKQLKNLLFINVLALLILYSIPLIVLFSLKNYSSINYLDSVVSSAYIMIVGAFVPVPGATGGIEYAFIAFFSNFIKGSLLNSMLLIWRFSTYYFGIMIGSVAFYLWKRRT